MLERVLLHECIYSAWPSVLLWRQFVDMVHSSTICDRACYISFLTKLATLSSISLSERPVTSLAGLPESFHRASGRLTC